ncbi:MAG: hypothetical protein PHU27_00465 [Salinivirgaceae bacterium]|nr:hypothetical protein [Salinivirgaceae bacterium]MDD4745843.1 hypothetical protein [Salinivirgaceae bacterium]MDY0281261.1 hypothetical protein [Salinivirgaceae bacterium]
MDDFFEIVIYVVVVGFFIFYNFIKGQKQKERLANQPTIPINSDLNDVDDFGDVSNMMDVEPKYSLIRDLHLSNDKVEVRNSKKTKENVNKQSPVILGAKEGVFNPIYDNQISSKQKIRRINLREAIVLSEIINRPYN